MRGSGLSLLEFQLCLEALENVLLKVKTIVGVKKFAVTSRLNLAEHHCK